MDVVREGEAVGGAEELVVGEAVGAGEREHGEGGVGAALTPLRLR